MDKPTSIPKIAHNIMSPYDDVPVLDFYKGYYDCVYVMLHPFIKEIYPGKFNFSPTTWPTKAEILEYTQKVSWAEFVKISGEGVHLLKLNEILAGVVQKISPSAVQQVVVIAVPDARTENRIEIVIGTEQLSAADVLHLCQQFNALVAPYEKIRKEHFISEIPRSPLGKVLWGKLRESLE